MIAADLVILVLDSPNAPPTFTPQTFQLEESQYRFLCAPDNMLYGSIFRGFQVPLQLEVAGISTISRSRDGENFLVVRRRENPDRVLEFPLFLRLNGGPSTT